MSEAPRILITRLRYLGDVILTTPLILRLRERFPHARLEYLVEEPYAAALRGCPHLDAVHLLAPGAGVGPSLRLLRRLRGRAFDWTIDLFGNPRSALVCALSGAHHRVGSQRGLRSRLYGYRRGRPAGDPSAIRHHLDKAIPLVGEELPPARPQIWIDSEERDTLRNRWPREDPRGVTLLHPGSKWAHKAWPRDRWPELGRRLSEAGMGPLRVVRPPGEEGVTEWICQRLPEAEPLPQMDLRSLLVYLSQVRFYIGNDGGILHAAVALGRPTVGLFGPTDPQIWFPYAEWGPYRVIRPAAASLDPAGAGPAGLEELSVDEVWSVVAEVWERSGGMEGMA